MMSRWFGKKAVGAVAAACLLVSGCGGGSGAATKITVSMNPPNGSSVNLFVNQTFQFSAQAVGATDQSVIFALSYVPTATPTATPTPCVTNPTPTTNPDCGTLSAITSTSTTTTSGTTTITNTIYSVTYTAPALVPNPAVTITLTATATADSKATAKATINLDSGIRVSVTPATATIGTGESFQFTASLTNDPTPNDVTWSVTQSNAGTVSATGLYTAPATVPATPTATVVATSVKDPARTGSATVTIVTAAVPTFSGIAPALGVAAVQAPQGALFHDIYLLAGNLRSTTTVAIDTVPVLVGQLKIVNSSLARLRLNAANLQSAGTLTITVLNGTTPVPSPANPVLSQVDVVPVRPALISSIPDSATSGTATGIQLNGGYFGPSGGTVVTGQFDGPFTQTITPANPRQLSMDLAAGNLGAAGPGLYQVSVSRPAAAPALAATNIAAQPDPAVNAPSVVGAPLALGGANPAPVAIAVDSTTGIAIVANSGNNTLQRLSVSAGALALLGAPITLTGSPTALAVDESQHFAAVTVADPANPATLARFVQLFNLGTGAQIGTSIDLTSAVTATPIAVALDPDRKLGLVAFASTSIGLIFNTDPAATPACLPGLGTSPYCVIGSVNMTTGANPHIAFHPRLHWAFVTPGGTGQMSVVDMAAPQNKVAISATAGAKRAANIVTITTATAHNIDPARLPTVLISGVADNTFNGSFTVTAVVDATTFTYAQVAPDATSSAGFVNYSRPLLTFSVSASMRGIAINPQTDRAVLTDGNGSFASFLSTLDQATTSVSLHPATGAAYQPFTNVAVVVKPGTIGATGQELLTLLNPGTPGQFSSPPSVLAEISTNGTGSVAVAVDPPTNQALVVNTISNDISLIALGGTMKTPQISRIEIADPTRQIFPQATSYDPAAAAPPALTVKVFGAGFAGSTVRLDGTALSGATVLSSREIDVDIPASFLAAPRRFALDVVQGSAYSNVTDFTVVAAVNIAGTGCASPQPSAVAIDDIREEAVVTNLGCNNVSVIDLATAQISATIAVGTTPAGVATIPRLGYAVVTNSNLSLTDGTSLGIGSASIVDLATNAIRANGSVNLSSVPTAVAINQDTGKAYILNTGSNTMSVIDLTVASPSANTVAVDQRPISIAIDPERNVALIGALQQSGSSSQGILDVLDISVVNPTTRNRISAFPSLPTGVAFDPANSLFYAVSSLGNTLLMANPDTGGAQSVRVGVNPTSLAYNFQTGTLLTLNTLSNTLSFVDMQSLRTRAVISLGAPPSFAGSVVLSQFAAAIHPRTNLAVVADPANGRVLLLPMPR